MVLFYNKKTKRLIFEVIWMGWSMCAMNVASLSLFEEIQKPHTIRALSHLSNISERTNLVFWLHLELFLYIWNRNKISWFRQKCKVLLWFAKLFYTFITWMENYRFGYWWQYLFHHVTVIQIFKWSMLEANS